MATLWSEVVKPTQHARLRDVGPAPAPTGDGHVQVFTQTARSRRPRSRSACQLGLTVHKKLPLFSHCSRRARCVSEQGFRISAEEDWYL